MREKYLLALLLLSLTATSHGGDEGMAGEWTGYYQTLRAFDGELAIRIEEEETGYLLTVVSANEHYPAREPERLEHFHVGDDAIRWTIRWGPSTVTFSGTRDGDFLVGEIAGRQANVDVSFGGYWIAVREAARRD